jgi:gluconokinase
VRLRNANVAPPQVILLMGVSGSGKTTIGQLLGKHLGFAFFDADDLHPKRNVEKMRRGIPLDDADRAPWLASVRDLIQRRLVRGEPAVVACSALKQAYRDELVGGRPDQVRVVYLKGTPELIARRLGERRGHFMSPAMLTSQLATLEEPNDACTVDVEQTPEAVVRAIAEKLGLARAGERAETG